MYATNGEPINLQILIAYGLLILLYLFILKLMMDLLQSMGQKHTTQRFIVDADIRNAMTSKADQSMHTFDAYGIAIVIAKGGIAALGMAALIVVSTMKFGFLATMLIVAMVVLCLYALNLWVKSLRHTKTMQTAKRVLKSGGNIGTVIMLSISLVVLLFIMTFI